MVNETLATTLIKGINNPDCSFFVGSWLGAFFTFRIIVIVIIAFFIFKVIDSLIINPILSYLNQLIKSKFEVVKRRKTTSRTIKRK